MADRPPQSLAAELDLLLAAIAYEFDPSQRDSETTDKNVRLLAYAATCFNLLAIEQYGGRLGPIRAHGLVEQIVGAAFQSFEGVDPHPSPFDKAAMLLRGITQGHPFNDGNKRTGLLTAAYFLSLMGLEPPPTLSTDEAISLCMRVSAGELRDVTVIARELQRLWGQTDAQATQGQLGAR